MNAHWKFAAGALATVGLAALPTSAGAAGAGTPIAKSPFNVTTSTVFAPCYVATAEQSDDGEFRRVDQIHPTLAVPAAKTLAISLHGGTPNDPFNLVTTVGVPEAGGVYGKFDANGNATVKLGAIVPDQFTYGLPVKGDDATVSFTDDGTGSPVNLPIAHFQVTQTALEYSTFRLGRPATISLSGMWSNEVNYLFVTNPTATKVLSHFTLPRANGCGYSKGRGVFFHQTHTKVGTYHIFVYDKPTLNEHRAWEYSLDITNP